MMLMEIWTFPGTFALCDANDDEEDMRSSMAKMIMWWLKTEPFPRSPAPLYSVTLIMMKMMVMMLVKTATFSKEACSLVLSDADNGEDQDDDDVGGQLNLSQGVLLPCTQ